MTGLNRDEVVRVVSGRAILRHSHPPRTHISAPGATPGHVPDGNRTRAGGSTTGALTIALSHGHWFPNQQSMLRFASCGTHTYIFQLRTDKPSPPWLTHAHSPFFFPLFFFCLCSVAPLRCKRQSAVTGPTVSCRRWSELACTSVRHHLLEI